ncbi:MAG: hypothetical protein P8X60_01535 [Robiginitalea sp.]
MKNRIHLLWLAAVLFAQPCILNGQFTLEQSLGGPYTESLKAAPQGDHLAWVVNEKGIRNIWYTPVGEPRAQQLTWYTEDDGLSISLEGVLDGTVIYVRGNGNNRKGEPANPASLRQTPEQQLLRLDIASGAIDTLVAASSAVLHANGTELL